MIVDRESVRLGQAALCLLNGLVIEFIDMTGKVVLRDQIDRKQTSKTLDLTRFAKGVYFLKASNQSAITSYKIVVQ